MIMSLQRQSDAKKMHFLCPRLTLLPHTASVWLLSVFSLISDYADQTACWGGWGPAGQALNASASAPRVLHTQVALG